MKPYCQRLVALIFVVASSIAGPYLYAQAPAAPAAAPAQNLDMTFGNTRWFPSVLSPYESPYVPETKMTNSERLHGLLRDGKLYLSLEDLIELALEDNLDIAVARYNIAFAHTDVLRTQGGGAARGFSGSFQSSALFSGAVGSGVTATTSGVGGRKQHLRQRQRHTTGGRNL